MAELRDGCVKPSRGPIMPSAAQSSAPSPSPKTTEVPMLARVGHEAIDFEAGAFVSGFGFRPVKLSDYRGKWIVLCFYPGDFTFV